MPELEDLQKDPISRRLRAWDPHSVAEVTEYRGERTLLVPRSHLRRVAELLAGDAELDFNFLSDITGVDRFPVEPRFELNYHMVSLSHRVTLRLRVRLHGSDPVAPSVTPVWATANWHEREIFDMFGVRFEGHPDLRRILMPDDWEGHPMRKDYPVEGCR
ncbi:MAG: NADH-quinone oxidoreductase subunit C [Candidatus Acidiferrales bacterium]